MVVKLCLNNFFLNKMKYYPTERSETDLSWGKELKFISIETLFGPDFVVDDDEDDDIMMVMKMKMVIMIKTKMVIMMKMKMVMMMMITVEDLLILSMILCPTDSPVVFCSFYKKCSKVDPKMR